MKVLKALALTLSLCFAAQAADAAGCYDRSGYIKDICPSGGDLDYNYYGAFRAGSIILNGHPYVLYGSSNRVDVYDAANPLADSWKSLGYLDVLRRDDPDTHNYQIPHVKDIETIDDFPYIVLSLYNYGWDIARLNNGVPTLLKVGYAPPAAELGTFTEVGDIEMFTDSGSTYLVGRRLRDVKDGSVYVYQIGDPTGKLVPESVTYATLPITTRLPLGGALDPEPFSSFPLTYYSSASVFTMGASRYVLVGASGRTRVLALIDITQPTFPKPVAYWTSAQYDSLFAGTLVVDGARRNIYVADSADEILHVWDISTPATPVKRADVRYMPSTGSRIAKSLALTGDILAVGANQSVRYVNVADPTVQVVLGTELDPFTAKETFATDITRSCLFDYGDVLSDMNGFSVNGTPYFVRMMSGSADVVGIGAACLDTTPAPDLSVTGPGANCTGGDAQGYPGDGFTVTNRSAGAWEPGSAKLVVSRDGVPVPALNKDFLAQSSIVWTPPATAAPGVYTLDVTVVGTDDQLVYSSADRDPPTSKTVTICSQPQASLGYTPQVFLTGDSLTFSAQASDGSPSGATWLVNGAIQTGETSLTHTHVMDPSGSYVVAVVVHYGHAGADDLSACTGIDVSGATNPDTYDACATVQLDVKPYYVGDPVLTQGASAGPTFLTSAPISVSVEKDAGGDWTFTGVSWTLTRSSDGGDASAAVTPLDGTATTFAAEINTAGLAENTDYVLSFAADASSVAENKTEPISRTAAAFTVTDCQPLTAPTNLSPSGTTLAPGAVTFSWTASSGTGPITYTVRSPFGGIAPFCTATNNATSCSAEFSSGGTVAYVVEASHLCGTDLASAQATFTIQSTTPPPTPTPTPTTPPSCTRVRPVANFTYSPSAPAINQSVKFTDTSTNLPDTWSWDFGFGGIGGIGTSQVQNPSFAFPTAQSYTVKLTVSNCAGSSTVSKTVTVTNPCTTPKPVANFTWTPTAPKAGQSIQFSDLTTGTVESYAWDFGYGELGLGTSTVKNPVFSYPDEGTYTVTLTATNCGGSSVKTATVTVGPACDQPAPPTADFTWGPTGALEGFPEQMQPYAGQDVQFQDLSTNAPDAWHWVDFQESHATYEEQNPVHRWDVPGTKNVRLTAHNCAGDSAQVLKTVTVYADVRHVSADFEAASEDLTTGVPLTFTAYDDAAHGDPTTFSWTCDDGGTHQGATIEHTFSCRGTHSITLTASRGAYSDTATKQFEIGGDSCGPSAVVVTDTAKTEGLNGSDWRTDMRIFNFSDATANVQLRVKGTDGDPEVKSLPALGPHQTLLLEDLLASLGLTLDKASVWLEYVDGEGALSPQALAALPDHHLPNISTRTYTRDQDGGSYGQAIPSFLVYPESHAGTLWLTGMVDNGTVARSEHRGFRSNLTLVNTGGSWAGKTITISMITADGTVVRQREMGMGPYSYVQYFPATKVFVNDPVDQTADVGPYAMRIEVPDGVGLLAGCSVVDNATNDPFFTLARPRRDGESVFVAARNPGLLGTTWRTDLQLTNTTEQERTWQLFFQPKGDYPTTAKTATLAPLSTWRQDDVIAWLINPYPVPDAIQGQITISPVGAETDLPAAASRTYNLTDAGTFGQNNPLMHTSMAASEKGANTRLIITGMSSEDIARTNLGFLNLSQTSDVNLTVTFYDEAGNELNPGGFKYWYAAGGWSQVKLEDRFNSGGVELPANQRSISAVIQVTHGGPMTAYASVVDSLTGDPVTVLAQPAP